MPSTLSTQQRAPAPLKKMASFHQAVAGPDEKHAEIEAATPKKLEAPPPGLPVPPWKPQLAMAVTQTLFVVGSVYLKSAIKEVDNQGGEEFHPIVYAFLREIFAGPLLLLGAWWYVGLVWPKRPDLPKIAALGGCLFLSQLFFITGIELSGVVVATCMQPVIPVFTAILGVAFKLEHAHPQKFIGIGLAVVGAVSMVLGGIAQHGSTGGHVSRSDGSNMVAGNLCLLVNTMAMAAYYVLAKQMVHRYPVVLVAAWAYITAAACMGTAAAVFTSPPDWHFPMALVLPLVYWILICSVMGYFLVTWATRHLPASQVASFQCLQPFIGTVLAFGVLGEMPTWWDLGAIGIVVGLLLIVKDHRDFEPIVTRIRKHLSTTNVALLLQRVGSQQALAGKWGREAPIVVDHEV